MKNSIFKITVTALFLLVSIFQGKAQDKTIVDPFKGFHLSISGQVEFVQPAKFIPSGEASNIPLSRWTTGYNGGIELSYNFAKYFGFAIGLKTGTAISYNELPFVDEITKVTAWRTTYRENDFFIPFKFEFHYPVSKHIYIMTEIGGSLNAFMQRQRHREGMNHFVFACTDDTEPSYSFYDGQDFPSNAFYVNRLDRLFNNIECDLTAGVGIYYLLPYGDMLRLSFGYNYAFKDFFKGNYAYLHTDNNVGTCHIKHDYIYTQFAYTHTFNYERAKRILRKQNREFNSKKEKRKEILQLLNY